MATAPSVYNIETGLPFVDALAAGLIDRWGAADEPLALARALVLLPNRRACRALRDAFLRRAGGRPLALPRLLPVGDVDEDELALLEAAGHGSEADAEAEVPPAIPPLRRRMLLARQVQQWSGDAVGADQAVRLAAALARLIDQVEIERLSFAELASLVPDEFARHWQLTLEFLAIVTEEWPKILAEEGALDPAERRNRLLAWQARAWTARPPGHPVIAAGSTGSVPATAELLAVVARLPEGALVLPGLDTDLDDESWAALGPSHPQFGLRQLLASLGVARSVVAPWPAPGFDFAPAAARRRLVAEAMRPAETSDQWAGLAGLDAAALAGLGRIDCPTSHEEAGVIALILREALEGGDGRTAALVTPDRDLARRVAAELGRWQVEIDDSAGVPLADTPPGAFLRLTGRAVAEAAAPVPLLAALKHPLATGGLAPGVFRSRVRALERALLRGPRPAPGFAALADGLERRQEAVPAALVAWTEELAALARPFEAAMTGSPRPLSELLGLHVAFAEALSAGETSAGADALWAGEAGAAAAAFVADLAAAGDVIGALPGRRYPALLEQLMAGRVVRPRYGTHPRLAILGPMEARLQSFDTVVLGGLNEGTWPAEVEADPWMSRPMRAAFGLPLPERRIGLAAHDFQQATAAPRVVLTRAERVEGTPTVPSRWLTRLENVVRAAGLEDAWPDPGPWLSWWRRLDAGAGPPRAAVPPAPRPPVAARPRRLSVTQIETWMRDPYAIYARHILGLKALDPIDAAPDAAAYGTLIHRALDRFVAAHPTGPLPPNALSRLLVAGEAAFGPALGQPGVWAFWWPRFERIARWFVAEEVARRAAIAEAISERRGELSFAAPGGPFILSAVADRIERMADGTLAIIDYKTGTPPSKKEVAAGFAPQLPLEAAIARAGGFRDLPGAVVSALAYWRLAGGEPAGRVHAAGDDPSALADAALAGLQGLVACFDDPSTAYVSRPRPDAAPRYSDYEHLARVREWAAGEEEAP